MAKKSACITLRCLPELKDRVVALSQRENRTISEQVIHLLEMGLDSVETKDILEPQVSQPEGVAEWPPAALREDNA